MNVNFLNPFVTAAFEVIQAEARLEAQRGSLSLEKTSYRTEDVTVVIGLVGAVEGTVFYSMDETTALLLVSGILGEQMTELNPLAQSGISELANVITGRASALLSQSGYEATISPPTLILGRDALISTLDYLRLLVPMILDGGRLNIHLALRSVSNTKLSAAELAIPEAPTPL